MCFRSSKKAYKNHKTYFEFAFKISPTIPGIVNNADGK